MNLQYSMCISTSSKYQDREFIANWNPSSATPTIQNHFITNLHVQQGQVVQDIDFWNSIVQSLPVSTLIILVMQISICKSQNEPFRACFWNLFRQASTPLSRIQPSTLVCYPEKSEKFRDSMAIVAVELGFLLSFSSDFVSLPELHKKHSRNVPSHWHHLT